MLLNCGVGEDSWQPLGHQDHPRVHPKGNQLWIFIGRTDADGETPTLWPLDGKNWLISKDPDARKDWRRQEKGTAEDEMIGRHHWLADMSLSKLRELVMPSNHLILCHPLLLLPSVLPSIRVFSNESDLCIRWPKYWSFSFSISPSNEHPGLISFRMD